MGKLASLIFVDINDGFLREMGVKIIELYYTPTLQHTLIFQRIIHIFASTKRASADNILVQLNK